MKARPDNGVIIIGAGQAGARVAIGLRNGDFRGPIVLIGDENDPPYERPQLSKRILDRDRPTLAHALTSEAAAAAGIELVLGDAAIDMDRKARLVRTRSGRELAYDHAVLATGGRARPLPLAAADGDRVFALRNAADAVALAGAFDRARSVLVIGGGWLGLEIASAARRRGLEVSVIEAGERLCGRAAPHDVSERLAAMHRRNGVSLLIGRQLASLARTGTGIGAVLSDGATVSADIAVVAIGLVPNVELAGAAGLSVGDGIEVDAQCRTSDPAIFAVGDCCIAPFHGQARRLESWQNANTQSDIVVAALLGQPLPPLPLPWFWSDQHGLQVQMVGSLADGHDRLVRGSGDTQSILFLDGRRLVGVVAFGVPRDIGMGMRLIRDGACLDPVLAADISLPLVKARVI